MARIGILQPVFLPWLGYFEQMARVDHFVFLDDVQYTAQDWRNRNRIKTASGSIWLTVPVKGHPLGALIRGIEINQEQKWLRKHLLSIEQNYRNCPHFQPFFRELSGQKRFTREQKVPIILTLSDLRGRASKSFSSATGTRPTHSSSGFPFSSISHRLDHEHRSRRSCDSAQLTASERASPDYARTVGVERPDRVPSRV